MTGKVKWFDGKKGFGFLTPDDGSEEVFVHHSAIRMKGYRELETGQAVEFDAVNSDRGIKALNVVVLPGSREVPQSPIRNPQSAIAS